jgi:hypothetical protein
MAETVSEANVSPGEPTANFITAIVTQPAIGSDDAGLPLVEQEQAQMGLEKPSEWYVDAAYVSAERLAQAQLEGREMIGPAQPAPTKDGRFNVEQFEVSVEERRAVCPAGKSSTQCSRLQEQETDKVTYRFEFSTHCHDCPLRQQCVGKDQPHRTITVGQHHTHLQARRREQRTEAFKLRYRRRYRGNAERVGPSAWLAQSSLSGFGQSKTPELLHRRGVQHQTVGSAYNLTAGASGPTGKRTGQSDDGELKKRPWEAH